MSEKNQSLIKQHFETIEKIRKIEKDKKAVKEFISSEFFISLFLILCIYGISNFIFNSGEAIELLSSLSKNIDVISEREIIDMKLTNLFLISSPSSLTFFFCLSHAFVGLFKSKKSEKYFMTMSFLMVISWFYVAYSVYRFFSDDIVIFDLWFMKTLGMIGFIYVALYLVSLYCESKHILKKTNFMKSEKEIETLQEERNNLEEQRNLFYEKIKSDRSFLASTGIEEYEYESREEKEELNKIITLYKNTFEMNNELSTIVMHSANAINNKEKIQICND